MKVTRVLLAISITCCLPCFAQSGTVDTYITQAKGFEAVNRFGEAETAYQNALREANRLGANSPKIPETLELVADFYRTRGQYSKAEPLYKREAQLRETLTGKNTVETAESYRQLGLCCTFDADYPQAQDAFAQALDIQQRLVDNAQNNNQMSVASSRLQLAQILEDMSDLNRRMGNDTQANTLIARARSLRANPQQPEVQ